ncbi:uncharacterized protein LOC116349575 isoform X2 [Contarinia nasturtii]|uniref:uncharacterized protein LOC116349575 isoform X2 n=1 Tax=Contarinia nasturtii TaxID=265458 RepID=UPI0012D3B27D|nr:uncharacterized protein LOC116349575 isoform X2 [Contarinia nasturtii]
MIRLTLLLIFVAILSAAREIEHIEDEPCTYDLARHHIIAYSKVKEFFETAAVNVKNRELRRRLAKLFEKLATHPNEPMNEDDHTSLFERNAFEKELSTPLQLLGIGSYDARRVAISLIRWIPFNIFKGPAAKNRVDDPKNGFEENAGRIVNADTRDNLENLHILYDNMINYVNTDSVDNFKNSINLMEHLLIAVPKGYRDFTMSDWELVGIQIKGHTKLCKFRIKSIDES